MIGSYNVNVQIGKFPQKVASYFEDSVGKLLGASYEPVAYLGNQIVNGTNHAILCEQTVITGKDTKNAVLVILNEKPEGLSLVSITPIVESGKPLGGTAVNVTASIPESAQVAFDKAFSHFVGSSVNPFALLGTQVVHGTNYIFAAEVSAIVGTQHGVIGGNPTKICKVTLNDETGEVSFDTILE